MDNSFEIRVSDSRSKNLNDIPKAFFTCHPLDFNKTYSRDSVFDTICNDIFRTHEIAIYYTKDMTAEISDENRNIDLMQMNFFIVPVTYRLLTEPNRTMQSDIVFAKENNIPILPFMMEPNIDDFYSKEENFGKKQYLSPFSNDQTEISYRDKLKKTLDSLVLNNETIERIRNSFDAYIFLSYRKVDRVYANTLMHIIHDNPAFTGVAIWYDEFLVPGEEFNKTIENEIKTCDLFLLLITPNILKYNIKRKPNYIITHEYPVAYNAGKRILPVEMVKTNGIKLKLNFNSIPPTIKVSDNSTECFNKKLTEIADDLSLLENNDNPEKLFLIGLAYLNGIDVEVNISRGVKLITRAAETGYPDAMEKLCYMYRNGDYVKTDLEKAYKWGQKTYDYYAQNLGEGNRETLSWLGKLACLNSDYAKALEINEEAYYQSLKYLGEEDDVTLTILNNLALDYAKNKQFNKALEFSTKSMNIHAKKYGYEDKRTLIAIDNSLSILESTRKCPEKVLETSEMFYRCCCNLYGEKSSLALNALNRIACNYYLNKQYKKAIELGKIAHILYCDVYGDVHPETLNAINNLAYYYEKDGNLKESLNMYLLAYKFQKKILGENHRDTLVTLSNISMAYMCNNILEKALETGKEAYARRLETFGDMDDDTLTSLENLAFLYAKTKNDEKAIIYAKKAYNLSCEKRGKSDDSTVELKNLITRLNNKKDRR